MSSENKNDELKKEIKHNLDIGMSRDEALKDVGFQKVTADNPEVFQKYFYIEVSALPHSILDGSTTNETLDIDAEILINAIRMYVKSRKEHGYIYDPKGNTK